MMPTTEIQDKTWQCKICGSFSTDKDQSGITWEQHLDSHNIHQDRYDTFVNEDLGGTAKLNVKLLSWSNNVELALISFISQTWGATFDLHDYSDEEVDEMVLMALKGETLSTALEAIQFTFQIDGLSRASSHQLVRVRIGSGFSQKGMSDAYYGDIDYVVPASIEAVGKTQRYLDLMKQCSAFYDELFDDGVPFQDARFVIPHAATTSLVWTVNYLALKNFCQKRMQNSQSWEMNALSKLLREEIRVVSPLLADPLAPLCELTGRCHSFGNLFEGCGKYPFSKMHDRYVFDKSFITKNLKFDEASVDYNKNHNKSVKKKNNHFLLTARERLEQKSKNEQQ